ncbi:hypothetical protein QA642_07335 [Bradyrhizobium sp. CB2312]|nr:hypothetical protein [Bradyrhizobium sp. CB2312]WFU73864.1 hypothetical protein QA642_07335 [Bradyrhizobium sp. CB2312]
MHLSDFVLLLNALWFGGAFIQFSIAQRNTLKILLPREERSNPIAPTLAASVAFLGGMNLPIGLLSLYLLAARPSFFQPVEAQLALFLFFAACHFSQFAYNPGPDARRARRGGILAGAQRPDAQDLRHRRGAVRGQSRRGAAARISLT